MMGAQVSPGGAIDLASLTDAATYGERLKTLTEQTAAAQRALEQARDENQAMVAKKEEVEAINAATLEMLNRNLALEADLKQREAVLAVRLKLVIEREDNAALAKEHFDAEMAAAKADLAKQAEAVRKYEAESKLQQGLQREAMEREYTERQAQLETIYRDQMAVAQRINEQATIMYRSAENLMAEAEAKRIEYEGKLAELKKLVG